jgi:hypothetical protein
MHLIPDGYFIDDHIVFCDLGGGSVIAKGYAAEFPDLSASEDDAFSELEAGIRLILSCLSPDERLQLHFYTSSDFAAPLDRFSEATWRANGNCPEITRRVRDELLVRFRSRMHQETLIQGQVRLYVSSRLPKFVTERGRKVRGFEDVFKIHQRAFQQREVLMNLLLCRYGGSVRALDNLSHYREMVSFWSPGQARVLKPERGELDWLRSVEDLCRFSEVAPRALPDHGFFLDGFYFGLWVFKTMPRATWAKTMEPFFALTIPNLRVVVNIQPLPIEGEMRYEEERFNKLLSNLDPKAPSLQSEVGLDKHRDRMRRLMSNQVLPFKAQIIVIGHDRTTDGLDSKMQALRAALGKTGAEPYRPALPTSVISFFNCATPGFGPWVDYPDYRHKIDDLNLANLLPAGSTPKAELDQADWITDGDRNNLIGGKAFTGSQPVHAVVIGNTGAGKSVILQTLILQTALSFKFIVVVDDGLSYARTCRLLDPSSRPIIVRSNGGQTFNPFDIRGLPLTPQHLASATALVHLLLGRSSNEDQDKLRSALIAETIGSLYGVAYRSWRKDNPEAHYKLCREAATLLKLQEAKCSPSEGLLEAFLLARELRRTDPNALVEFQEISERDVLELDRHPDTQHLVQALAYANWTPEMFPTISDLQDELHTAALGKGAHQELLAVLATLLRPWLRDGRYGPIVDGASNVDLGRPDMSDVDPLKVVHFELGELSKAEAELRAVCGFLITNEVRNHIQGMPRRIRKQVVLEELTSFLKIPNGEEIVTDYYERMRKYSCQVISVFQQYSSLLEASPKVAKAIIGNSSAMFLLRNHNRRDLDGLSSFVKIPEVIKDRITSFPMPENMKGRDDAYAGFVYAQLSDAEPRFTIGRNVISEEVERITSSSGDAFQSKRELTN